MGFGLLFIGYFVAFLMSIHSYGWAVQILGFYIIFRALLKLSEYKHSFTQSFLPLALATVCQLLFGVHSFGFFEAMTGNFFTMIRHLEIEGWINTASLIFVMIFHFLLLRSIKELAADVEDLAIARLAKRNMFVVGAYFILDIAVMLLPSGSFKNVLFVATLLASIAYPICILYLLFRCYARICAPEDKDMEPKPSRFAFINKRRERQRDSDKNMDKLVERLDQKKNPKKK